MRGLARPRGSRLRQTRGGRCGLGPLMTIDQVHRVGFVRVRSTSLQWICVRTCRSTGGGGVDQRRPVVSNRAHYRVTFPLRRGWPRLRTRRRDAIKDGRFRKDLYDIVIAGNFLPRGV